MTTEMLPQPRVMTSPVGRRLTCTRQDAADRVERRDVTVATTERSMLDAEQVVSEAYRKHAGAVFAMARRLLKDRTLAEEVTQEVFLRLWKDPDRFDADRGTLRSYLFAQCHGRSIDLIRAETSRRRREDATSLREPPSGDCVELVICERATAETVARSLDALPDAERDAITLAFFEGHTYRQVAALLGTPEGTVKSQIRRGLERLRTELADGRVGTLP